MYMGLTGYLSATVVLECQVFWNRGAIDNVHHLSSENFICHLSCGNYQ